MIYIQKRWIQVLLYCILGGLLLAITMPAFASATFGTVSGPTWNGATRTWNWNVQVLTISNPDKQVCFQVAPNATCPGTGTYASPVSCTCSGSLCGSGVGDWTCSVSAGSVPNDFLYRVGTYSGGGACGTIQTVASSGCAQTSPTAIELNNTESGISTNGIGAAFAVLSVLLTIASIIVGWKLTPKVSQFSK